jgi:hypothetical protein
MIVLNRDVCSDGTDLKAAFGNIMRRHVSQMYIGHCLAQAWPTTLVVAVNTFTTQSPTYLVSSSPQCGTLCYSWRHGWWTVWRRWAATYYISENSSWTTVLESLLSLAQRFGSLECSLEARAVPRRESIERNDDNTAVKSRISTVRRTVRGHLTRTYRNNRSTNRLQKLETRTTKQISWIRTEKVDTTDLYAGYKCWEKDFFKNGKNKEGLLALETSITQILRQVSVL